MPLNKNIIGKKYSSGPFEITAHDSIYYALACNEDNDAYFDNRREGGIIAPPMYAVRYSGEAVMMIINDKETGLDFQTSLHYSQEFHWIRPVYPGDMISSEAEITHLYTQSRGGVLGWGVVSKNQNNEEVCRAKWEFFDRSAGEKGAERMRMETSTPGEITWTQEMNVRNGQTFIYAEPSGDHNAIHINDDFARSVGLRGIILHGLCTMAFAHKAMVDNLCGPQRDPLRLKRLYVQFYRPVIPGEKIQFQGYENGKSGGRVRHGIIAKNGAGKEVLKNSWCEIE